MENLWDWYQRWWKESDAARRYGAGDPSIVDEWEEAQWERARAEKRRREQGAPAPTGPEPPDAALIRRQFDIRMKTVVIMQGVIKARITGTAPAPRRSSGGEVEKERPSERVDKCVTKLKEENARIGTASGPDAVVKAAIDLLHPLLQRDFVVEARHMRRDILDGVVEPEKEYGKTKEEALSALAGVEAEAKAAIMSWTSEALGAEERKAIEAWQRKLRAEDGG